MKTIKVSEAIGPVLDWLVAECEGVNSAAFHYSTVWSQGGPIIEREIDNVFKDCEETWFAIKVHGDGRINSHQHGPTPLIAAMRCFVASKLGEEAEVPEELG